GTERFSLFPGSGTLSPRRGFLLDVEIASPGPTSVREIRQETSMQTLSANCHREPSRQLVRPSKLMLLLTTFMLAAGIPSALATRFIPMPPVFATGGVPQQVVPADVNKDGIADLITSNANGVVSVLLGKGGGSFAAPVTIATIAGGGPSIAVADFNGDGSPDL